MAVVDGLTPSMLEAAVERGVAPTLASLLAGLSSRTLRVRVLRAMTSADALRRTIEQHEGIYAALAARDPNLAQAMAVQHVLTTESWLRESLIDSGP